jgi:putative restriction endonuclease
MFDRGLISLSDNLEILLSSKINDIDGVRKIINSNGAARLPKNGAWRPHPRYLKWHREECFSG